MPSSFFPASCSWDAEDNTEESIQDEYELVFSGIVNERETGVHVICEEAPSCGVAQDGASVAFELA